MYSHIRAASAVFPVSEASSWAEHEHKWCFHSTLIPAIWILPQSLISMRAASSLSPALCCWTHSHTHLPSPPLYSPVSAKPSPLPCTPPNTPPTHTHTYIPSHPPPGSLIIILVLFSYYSLSFSPSLSSASSLSTLFFFCLLQSLSHVLVLPSMIFIPFSSILLLSPPSSPFPHLPSVLLW